MKNYLDHSFNTDDFDLVSIIDELPLWSAPFGMDLLESVNLKPNIRALDIGCGLGFPMIELAMRLGSTGKVFGIDPWCKAIERIKLKTSVLNIKNVEVYEGTAEELPFDDNYFDLVVSNNGLNNVEDLQKSLSECKRVSRTGAQLLFTFNLENTMKEFYVVFEEVMKANNLVDEIRTMKSQVYSKRKPIEEVELSLKDAGIEMKHIRHNSFKMDFLDGTTMFNHYLIKYWFLPGWKEILREEDQHTIFDQVEKKLNELAAEKGFFTLTIPFVTVDCVKKQIGSEQ